MPCEVRDKNKYYNAHYILYYFQNYSVHLAWTRTGFVISTCTLQIMTKYLIVKYRERPCVVSRTIVKAYKVRVVHSKNQKRLKSGVQNATVPFAEFQTRASLMYWCTCVENSAPTTRTHDQERYYTYNTYGVLMYVQMFVNADKRDESIVYYLRSAKAA